MSRQEEVDRQKRRDATARKLYAELAPDLPPEVRRALEDRDGRVSLQEHYEFPGHRADAAADARVEAPQMEQLDRLEDVLAEEFDLTPGQAAGLVAWHREAARAEADGALALRLARLLGALFHCRNLRLEIHALMYATGTAGANGLGSMRKAVASIPGDSGSPVTVAALSKRACWWRGHLQLPPLENMRSLRAVESYRQARLENHFRRNPARSKKLAAKIEKI